MDNEKINSSENMQEKPVFTPPVLKYYTLEKNDYVFALFSFFVSLIGVFFGIWGGFTAGFTVSFILYFVFITAYLFKGHLKLRVFPIFCAFGAIFLSGIFIFSDYVGINFPVILMLFALSALWVDSIRNPDFPKSDLQILGRVFTSTFGRAFDGLSTALRSLFNNKSEKAKVLSKILIGAVCALPVLAIVLPLLISSDAAFEGLISSIFDDLFETFVKIVISAAFAIGLTSYAYSHKLETPSEEKKTAFSGVDGAFIASFLGVLSICYLAYLFSQLAYFFNAFSGILPEAFNVADYARRGFFEMCAIAVINFFLLFITFSISRKKKDKPVLVVRIFSVFICLFTLVIIATALSKMIMYIERFGMTRLRIVTSSFMIFLGTVFIALLLKYFVPKIPAVKIAFFTGVCILLIVGYGNVDKVVAEYNIDAYRTGKLSSLDVDTIGNLGASGIPYLIELTDDPSPVISSRAKGILYSKVLGYYEIGEEEIARPRKSLGRWSLPEKRAYEALDEYIEENNRSILGKYRIENS